MIAPVRLSAAACLALALTAPGDARAQGLASEALADGEASLSLRYRHERVSQDGLPEDAAAHTLRTRLGYATSAALPVQAMVELEHVAHLGTATFNDTVHARTGYPVVADPEIAEINRAWVDAALAPGASARVGRHRIKYDNDRFVGNVGWRQNEQTFDGLRLMVTGIPGLQAEYAYVTRVNRIFGGDSRKGTFDTRNHFFRVGYAGPASAGLVGYGYLLDIEEAPALSSKTFGVRLTGTLDAGAGVTWLYTLEAARQSDHAGNPHAFDFGYWVAESGMRIGHVTVKAGYESLRGDGTLAFQTPLATLHAFQGFADIFLTTPPDGIDDYYASLVYKPGGPGLLAGTRFVGVYHQFRAAVGERDYGSELDLVVARKFAENFNASLKLARFEAGARGSDTTKLWLSLGYAY